MSVLHLQLFLTVSTAALAVSFGHDIIDGKKAGDDTLKYMASVQINGTHKCGGFLVGPNFVLTAAHCDKNGEMTVVLGTHSLKGDVKRRTVQRKIKHEQFKSSSTGNDIMLLKLSKEKSGKGVKPVKLPSKKPSRASTRCMVAGWGFTRGSKETTKDLQVANVKTIDMEECKSVWREMRVTLPENVICAGGYNTNKGACQGDSGGPLVCGDVAVGIVSFNLRGDCNYPNVPNVFTNIFKFLPWIRKNMGANS